MTTNDILWTSGFFNERFPAPVSPLGWSLIGPLIEKLALREPLRFLGYPDAENITLTCLWHGHPYANALAFQIFYRVFPDSILPEDAYRYFPDGDVSIRKRAPYPHGIDAPRFVFSLLRAFLSDPFNVSPLNNYRHWARYAREHDRRAAALHARFDALAYADPHEIFFALRQAETMHHDLLRIHRWSLMDADLTFGLLKRLVAQWIDRDRANDIAARLVANVSNKTLQVDAALREIGDWKLADGRWKLQAFLAEHGQRSFSLDIAVPTFADEPEQVIRLLQTTEDGGRRTADKFPSSVFHLPSGVKGLVLDGVISLARKYVAMREDQRYYWQKSLALSRHLYLVLGDRLVADNIITDRNAVFYATHQELADCFDGRLPKNKITQSIVARQAEWRMYQREFEQSPTTAFPPFLRGDAPFEKTATGVSHDAPCWHGRAVSPGIARGMARVVHSAEELMRVQRGEILVAPATDPAWTPVFAQIAGLVVERGGVLSHSAVVAREYHVPAVAGIPNIINAIHDGEWIEVDGSTGTVRRVQK